MASIIPRVLPAAGLADLRLADDGDPARLVDADKIRATPGGGKGRFPSEGSETGVLRAWPGYNRVGKRFLSHKFLGNPSEAATADPFGKLHPRLQVCACDEKYFRATEGHGVVIVDRNEATEGRIVSLGHQIEGIRGSQSIGQPVKKTGDAADTDTLETRGIFTRGNGRTYIVEIDGIGTGGDPDTFRWTDSGVLLAPDWNETEVPITGSWQTLGVDGVEIKFGRKTGHGFPEQKSYIVTNNTPAKVVTINRADFTRGAEVQLETGETAGICCAIDPAGAYLYVVCNTAPTKVVKVDLATMTRVGALTLTDADNAVRCVMTPDGKSLLVGSSMGTEDRVVRIDLATFTAAAFYQLEGETTDIGALAVAPDSIYAYAVTEESPSRVIQIDLLTMERVAELVLNSGENFAAAAIVDPLGENLYIAVKGTSATRVVAVELTGLSRTGALTLNSGEDIDRAMAMDPGGENLYIGTKTSPGKIVKVSIPGLTRVGAVTSPYDLITDVSIDRLGDWLYAGHFLSSSEIIKVDLSDFTYDAHLNLGLPRPELQSGAIDDRDAPRWVFICGGDPMHMGWLNRMGPHDYPSIVRGISRGNREVTLISTPWDTVKVDDGSVIREAGIPAPHLKPQVSADLRDPENPQETITTINLGDTDNATVQWTGLNGCTPSVSATFPEGQGQARAVQILIPSSRATGGVDIAYRSLTRTIPKEVKRITGWLYVDLASGSLPAGTFNLVLSKSAALGGTTDRRDLPIDVALSGRTWVKLDLPWDETADFACVSVGLKLVGSLPSSATPPSITGVSQTIANGNGTGFGSARAEPGAISGDWVVTCTRKSLRKLYDTGNGAVIQEAQSAQFDITGPGGFVGTTSCGGNGGDSNVAHTNGTVSFRMATSRTSASGSPGSVFPGDWAVGDEFNFTVENNVSFNSLPVVISKVEYTVTSVPSVTLLDEEGQWRGRFCWLQTATGRLSGPSPWSDPISVNATGQTYDLAGWYPGLVTGMVNSPPPGVDAIVFYLSNSTWGKDPRTDLGFVFRRYSPAAGHLISGFVNLPTVSAVVHSAGDPANDNAITNVSATASAAAGLWTLECTAIPGADDSTWLVSGPGGFSESFTMTGANGGTYDYSNQYVAFRIADSSTDFTIADRFYFNVTASTRTHGEMILQVTDDQARAVLNEDGVPQEPFYNGQPVPGKWMVADGQMVVSAGRPAYRPAGNWEFTDGSPVVRVVEADSVKDQVVIGRWMEGRFLRRLSEKTLYKIIKAIDTDSDGILDAVYVGQDGSFDPLQQRYTTGYTGASAEARAEIIADRRTMHVTNVTAGDGTDVETSSALSDVDVMPTTDGIVGGGKVGALLYVLGTKNAFIFRQNPGASADLPKDSGLAYDKENGGHIVGIGLAGERAWANRRNGTAVFIGSRAEIFVADPSGAITEHPASGRLSAFLSGKGHIVDTRKVRFAHCWIENRGDEEYLNVAAICGFDEDAQVLDANGLDVTHEPGVMNKGQDNYNFGEGTGEDALTPMDYSDSDAESESEGQDVEPLPGDFAFGVKVDLGTGELVPGSECRFTCSAEIRAASVGTTQGQLPGAVIVGTRDGYLGVFDESILTWGAPTSRFIYPVTGGWIFRKNGVTVAIDSQLIHDFTVTPEAVGQTWTISLVETNRLTVVGSVSGAMPDAERDPTGETDIVYNNGLIQFTVDAYDGLGVEDFTTFWTLTPFSGSGKVARIAVYSWPVEADFSGGLKGLLVAKISPAGIEYRRIVNNSGFALEVDTEWTWPPGPNDYLVIGPLHPVAQWSDTRSFCTVTVETLLAKASRGFSRQSEGSLINALIEPRMVLDILAGAAREGQIESRTPARRKIFDWDELKTGQKGLGFKAVAGEALGYRVRMVPGETGEFKLSGLQMLERWERSPN